MRAALLLGAVALLEPLVPRARRSLLRGLPPPGQSSAMSDNADKKAAYLGPARPLRREPRRGQQLAQHFS